MDFKQTFETIAHSFEKENLKYALIGGLALESAGVPRATADIDLLVLSKDMETVRSIMMSNGYQPVFESEEVATFIGSTDALGRVDFLLAHRKYTLAMIERAEKKPVLEGKAEISVVQPEDLIGLKIQAMANNPERVNREMADIRMVLQKNADMLDFSRIEEYFELFGRLADYGKLMDELKNAD